MLIISASVRKKEEPNPAVRETEGNLSARFSRSLLQLTTDLNHGVNSACQSRVSTFGPDILQRWKLPVCLYSGEGSSLQPGQDTALIAPAGLVKPQQSMGSVNLAEKTSQFWLNS